MTRFFPNVIEHCDTSITHIGPRPIPFDKRRANRLFSFIGIKIGVALPRESRSVKIHLYPCARCNWAPVVLGPLIKSCGEIKQLIWKKTNRSPHALGDRYCDLIKINVERFACPAKLARAYLEMMRIPRDRLAPPFCHCPSAGARAIECHVNCAVILRVGVGITRPCPVIVR